MTQPIATWLELCMDTTGGETLGRFWADVLGCEFRPDQEDGNVVSSVPGGGIAICRVPETKTVKHRVHLDVYGDPDHVVTLGGARLGDFKGYGTSWTTMTDPEGGEFDLVPSRGGALPAYRLEKLVIDAVDPEAVSRWWADAFATTVGSTDDGVYWWLEEVPDLPFDTIMFAAVPEPKTVKNRIHWDVYSDVDAMTEHGARLLRARDDEIRWNVMADPEGNEFCVFEKMSS